MQFWAQHKIPFFQLPVSYEDSWPAVDGLGWGREGGWGGFQRPVKHVGSVRTKRRTRRSKTASSIQVHIAGHDHRQTESETDRHRKREMHLSVSFSSLWRKTEKEAYLFCVPSSCGGVARTQTLRRHRRREARWVTGSLFGSLE